VLVEDDLSVLETDVLGPLYKVGEFSFGEDVLAQKLLLDADWVCVKKFD
jgi:hypothetical protein